MITTDIQIRFSDIDMLRHVNNGAIQQYYDVGKSEYFQEVVGVDPRWNKSGFIIVSIQTQFLEEILLSDNICVNTQVCEIGCKSITFYQEIIDKDKGSVKSSCKSVLVAFDMVERASMEISDSWREIIISSNKDIVIKK